MNGSVKNFAGYIICSPALESSGMNGKTVEKTIRKAFPKDNDSTLYIVKIKGVKSYYELYEDEMYSSSK